MAVGEDPAASIAPNGTVTVTTPAPKAGTPEHAAWVASMGGKVENNNGQVEKSAMPEGGVEKFFNKDTGAYDWSNHVKELNYRLEQGRAKSQAQKTPAEVAAEAAAATAKAAADAAKTPEQKAAEEVVKSAGLNWDTLEVKMNTTGELDPSDFEALEKAGIPKRIVENYTKAMGIARQAIVNEVVAYAGGEEQLNGLIGWAKDNLPQADKDSINSVLRSDQWKVALNDLKSRRAASLGGVGEPKLLHGQGAGTSGVGFNSPEEMAAAINKRDEKGRQLYKTDPAYHKQVREKIAAMQNFDPSRGIRY